MGYYLSSRNVNEFEDAKMLTEMLHKEWMKLSGLETKFWYFVDDLASVNELINLLVTQKIPLWFQNQQITTQNLSYLVELRKEVESKTKDSSYWVQKVLSIKIFQEYLLYFRHNHNVADGKQIKDLMYQLLTTKDAIAMSRKENSQLDYSKLKDILSWLDELPMLIKSFSA